MLPKAFGGLLAGLLRKILWKIRSIKISRSCTPPFELEPSTLRRLIIVHRGLITSMPVVLAILVLVFVVQGTRENLRGGFLDAFTRASTIQGSSGDPAIRFGVVKIFFVPAEPAKLYFLNSLCCKKDEQKLKKSIDPILDRHLPRHLCFKLFFGQFLDNLPDRIWRKKLPDPLLKGLNPLLTPLKGTDGVDSRTDEIALPPGWHSGLGDPRGPLWCILGCPFLPLKGFLRSSRAYFYTLKKKLPRFLACFLIRFLVRFLTIWPGFWPGSRRGKES